MKNYFLKGIVALMIAAIASIGFAILAFADNNSTFWSKQPNSELYTNSGNGLGNAVINVAGCNGCGSGLTSVLTDGVTIVGDGLNNPLTAVSSPDNKILTGGASWSGTGYTYDVSALTYYFDGFYSSSATQVTLSAADPSDDRFDAIVVDQSGTVSVITGTPSSNPVFPAIPDTELLVQYVFVAAGSTTPVILQDLIYDENVGPATEWTTSTYTTGTGATGTIDFNSTSSCKNGTKCMDATTNQRLGARFVRSTATDLQSYAYVQVWYRNNGAQLASNKTPSIRFENSVGTPVGNTVSLINHGISRTTVNTWQMAVIPVSAFGSISNVKGLRAIVTGGTLASQASWSLDFMLLSGGILPQGAIGPIFLSPSGTLYSSGAASGATGVANAIFFGSNSGFQATGANGSIFLGKNSGFQAINASNSVFIGPDAGNTAVDASQSVFIGTQAGVLGVSAAYALMIGYQAGYESSSANSVFMGNQAGYQSGGGYSVFIGDQSGYDGTQAGESVFIGWRAGYQAADANKSVFIGHGAGSGDTVDNSAAYGSILIGPATSTGGFSNSIAIGFNVTNTATNQFMIGSYDNIDTQIDEVIINGTGGVQVPVGTTAERIATQGMIRYNTTTSKFEGYDGSTWVDLN